MPAGRVGHRPGMARPPVLSDASELRTVWSHLVGRGLLENLVDTRVGRDLVAAGGGSRRLGNGVTIGRVHVGGHGRHGDVVGGHGVSGGGARSDAGVNGSDDGEGLLLLLGVRLVVHVVGRRGHPLP